MVFVQRDPQYIAEKVKFIRRMFSLTQQNVAEASGLTTRTIEKIESGKHLPQEQTLRSLARGLSMNVGVFDKPDPAVQAQQRQAMLKAAQKMLVVSTHIVRTTTELMAALDNLQGIRVDISQVTDESALEIAAGMSDWTTDMLDVWNEISTTEQLSSARSFVEMAAQLERRGHVCHMGRHGQRLRQKSGQDLTVQIGVLAVRSKEDSKGMRYALVQLEGAWERLEEDRMTVGDQP